MDHKSGTQDAPPASSSTKPAIYTGSKAGGDFTVQLPATRQHIVDMNRPDTIEDAVREIKALAAERLRRKNAGNAGARQEPAERRGRAYSDKGTAAPNATLHGKKEELDMAEQLKKAAGNPASTSMEAIVQKAAVSAEEQKKAVGAPAAASAGSKKVDGEKVGNAPSDATVAGTAVTDGASKPASLKVEAKPKPKKQQAKLPQTEDGFEPQPWVKRRYTIAQLLLFGEILPYVICPRHKFNQECFQYDLIHIPGIASRATGNPLVDQQIVHLNMRTETVAYQYFTRFGYRYLDRYRSQEHTLRVKGLWVEVRGSAGLRDRGGYRNAYRPQEFTKYVEAGLIKEDQQAEVESFEQRLASKSNNQNSVDSNSNYRGRGINRGGRGGRGGSYRGHRHFSGSGGPRPNFNQHTAGGAPHPPPITIPPPPANLTAAVATAGPPTPVVGKDIALATVKTAGTLHDISKGYASIELAHNEIQHTAAELVAAADNTAGDPGTPLVTGEVVEKLEQAMEMLAEKKAEITSKWGGVYGYSHPSVGGTTITRGGGAGGSGMPGSNASHEQQMDYIQYMVQAPLAPVVTTTPASGKLTPAHQDGDQGPSGSGGK